MYFPLHLIRANGLQDNPYAKNLETLGAAPLAELLMEISEGNAALSLLVGWPSLERAADLVISRVRETDGNDAERLTFAADRLSFRYPFAAMLLHR